MQDILVDDARDLINPEMTRWGKIAKKINSTSFAKCRRDGHACKFKWQKLLADYKKVDNHNKGTGMGHKEYFILSKQERKELHLPPKFDEDVFDAMHEWLKHKPTINPPTIETFFTMTMGTTVMTSGTLTTCRTETMQTVTVMGLGILVQSIQSLTLHLTPTT